MPLRMIMMIRMAFCLHRHRSGIQRLNKDAMTSGLFTTVAVISLTAQQAIAVINISPMLKPNSRLGYVTARQLYSERQLKLFICLL